MNDNYVRVPVEPTEEMIDAICAGSTECQWPDDFGKSAQAMRRELASRAYRALLSAAPQAEGAGPVTSEMLRAVVDEEDAPCEEAFLRYLRNLSGAPTVPHEAFRAAWMYRSALLRAGERDAERYRWLQHQRCGNVCSADGEDCYLNLNPRDLDAAIDAALHAALDSAMERKT